MRSGLTFWLKRERIILIKNMEKFTPGQEFERGRSLGSFGPEEKKEQIEEIRRLAQFGDVTYHLQRHFSVQMRDENSELIEIQRLGYISESIRWIKAMTPEGMKMGTGSTELRLEKAKEFAELAGTTVEEIAAENGLQLPKNK